MYSISDIVTKSFNREFLNEHLDLTILESKINPIITGKPIFKSNSLIASVIEQYILINQYKCNSNNHIEEAVKYYRNRLKTTLKDLEETKSEMKSIYHITNASPYSELQGIIFYDNEDEIGNYPPFKIYKLLHRKEITISHVDLFSFSDNQNLVQFSKYDEAIVVPYDAFYIIIESCFKELLRNVYSRKKISSIDLIKSLYFQNMLYDVPYYFVRIGGSKQDSIFRGFKNLFKNYDDEISNLCNLLNRNSDIIKNFGPITIYQKSCSYKMLRGRVDFVTEDSIIELKSGKANKKNDILQLVLYALIAQRNKDINKKRIRYFKVFYLNYNLLLTFDITTILKTIKTNPKVFLDNLIELNDVNNKYLR